MSDDLSKRKASRVRPAVPHWVGVRDTFQQPLENVWGALECDQYKVMNKRSEHYLPNIQTGTVRLPGKSSGLAAVRPKAS